MKIHIPTERFFNKTSLKKVGKECLLGLGLTTTHYHSEPAYIRVNNELNNFLRETHIPKPKPTAPKSIDWDEALDYKSTLNKAWLKKAEKELLRKQTIIVTKIIEEDKMCKDPFKKVKLARQIVNTAKELNADPIEIACIVKRETHFEHINGTTGNGLMQVTRIAVKDMFQRSSLYNPKLSKLKEIYGTPDELYNAVKKYPEINLKVGTILFQSRLQQTNDNLYSALKSYNGSYLQEEYASNILTDITKYQKEYEKIKI